MSRIVAAVRRYLPSRYSRAVERAFLHGYHAGQHDAVGSECREACEMWERIDR